MILAGFDAAAKIKVIKVVREITGLGLAEAKAVVEGTPNHVPYIAQTTAITDVDDLLAPQLYQSALHDAPPSLIRSLCRRIRGL